MHLWCVIVFLFIKFYHAQCLRDEIASSLFWLNFSIFTWPTSKCFFWPIKCQCCPHIKASHIETGFYMGATLPFNVPHRYIDWCKFNDTIFEYLVPEPKHFVVNRGNFKWIFLFDFRVGKLIENIQALHSFSNM